METKTARLTVLMDPAKKRALEDWCHTHDVTPSQLVRKLIRQHLIEQGVKWSPSGAGESGSQFSSLE